MMDERQRVIRDLLVRLAEAGIQPDRPFLADYIPGQGWVFSQDEREPSSSSSSAGAQDATKVRPQVR